MSALAIVTSMSQRNLTAPEPSSVLDACDVMVLPGTQWPAADRLAG
jgi:K+/H+ antiporter YhaU regulatory subunit KhtT